MNSRSRISVLIHTCNEQDNILPMSELLTKIFGERLPQYDYEIIYIDNDSTDDTRLILRGLCTQDGHIKAIFNARNFGPQNSRFYGLLQTSGDCVVSLCCDFQDPPELIPEMVSYWEQGYKIVAMQKTQSDENPLMYFLRTCYYKTIRKMSDVHQIDHFTGFGLYDRDFINVLRKLHDPTPFLRGIVAELGYKIKIVAFKQPKRRSGKSKFNLYRLYDTAMLGFTSYTKIGLRIATFLGFGVALLSIIIALIYFVYKLVFWDRFVAGTAPILIGMFFLGSVILIFLGLMGEYILSMNSRLMNRPLVVEEERINFDAKSDLE